MTTSARALFIQLAIDAGIDPPRAEEIADRVLASLRRVAWGSGGDEARRSDGARGESRSALEL